MATFWTSLLVALGVFLGWDEDLRPEVGQALDWRAPAAAFENNGYLIALGIEAPASQDAEALGAEVLRRELGRFEALQTRHKEPPLEPLNPERVEKHTGLGDLGCAYAEVAHCVDFYLRLDRAALVRLLDQQKPLIDRFEAIWLAKHYTEVVPPLNTVVTAHLQPLRDASELQRIRAVLDIADGRVEEGLTRFATNAAHSRRFLQDSDTLISHAVALTFVHRDVRILSELMHRYPSIGQPHAALIDPILAPISGAPYALTKGFQHERALRLQVIEPLKHADAKSLVGPESGLLTRWIAALNFLPNATLNDAYALSALTLKLAEAEAPQLDAVKQEISTRYADYFQVDHTLFTRRNGTGRTLNAVGKVDFSRYVERQHDLNAFIAMVALQRQMAQGPAPGRAQWPVDPYHGHPMRQDLASGELVFEGRQPGSANAGKSSQYRVPLR